MKGVRFIKAMHPWPAGALALLPIEEADRMIREGFAVDHQFPGQPYAVEAPVVSEPAPVTPRQRPAPVYKTKRGV